MTSRNSTEAQVINTAEVKTIQVVEAKAGAIAPHHEGGVYVVDDGRVLEKPPTGGLRLPILRIVQAQSQDANQENVGKFHYLGEEEYFDEVRVVPVRVQVIRTKWPAGSFSKDRKPECWSQDGRFAAEGAAFGPHGGTQARACEGCEFRGADTAQGGCGASHVIACIDMDRGEVVLLQAGSARWLADTLAHDSNYRKRIVGLTTREVKSDKGRWFGFKLGKRYELTPEDMPTLKEAIQDAMDAALYAPQAEDEPAVPPAAAGQLPPPVQAPVQQAQQPRQAPYVVPPVAERTSRAVIQLKGAVTGEPELRYKTNGTPVTRFAFKLPMISALTTVLMEGPGAEALSQRVNDRDELQLTGSWGDRKQANGQPIRVFVLQSFQVLAEAQPVQGDLPPFDEPVGDGVRVEDLPF